MPTFQDDRVQSLSSSTQLVAIVLLVVTVFCGEVFTTGHSHPNELRGTGTERSIIDFLFSPCKCKCGVPNREGRFLDGAGELLLGYEFPWVALIQINKGSETSVPGALINNKYLITAASPLLNLTPYDVKVTLGQFDRCIPDVSSTNVSVEKIRLHSDFNPRNRAHDLALIKLSRPITFERRISPICLSVPGKKYLGQVATVVGWSKKSVEKEDGSCRPRKLGLPVLGPEVCFGTAHEPQLIASDKGCIGVVGGHGVICKEDAGGPVTFRSHSGIYELIGVLIDKNDCGNNGTSTALYTTINEHLWWIKENTKDACYCFKT